MKTNNLPGWAAAALVFLTSMLMPFTASAQDYGIGIDPPRQLPPVGQGEPVTKVFHLKAPKYFGAEVLPNEVARLPLAASEQGNGVFVHMRSPLIDQAIRAQLHARGIKTVDSFEEATWYLVGSAAYFLDSKPHPVKVVDLGPDFVRKETGEAPTVEGGIGDARRSIGNTLIDLAATAKVRATDPASLAVSVLETLVDQTGISNAIARERAADGKLQSEIFNLFDCYDQATRRAADKCDRGDLLPHYLAKSRLQVVEIHVRYGSRTVAPRRDRIVVRRIDPRAYKGVDLDQLLALGVAELTAGMGSMGTEARAPGQSSSVPAEAAPDVALPSGLSEGTEAVQ